MADHLGYNADAIIAQAADAIIFADREGVIRLWNKAAEAVFSFTADEVIGESLDTIIPERLRQAHWTAFHLAIQSGVTTLGGRPTITRAIHKSGKKLYVDMSFALVRDLSGITVGSVAVARDITAKYEAEKSSRS